MKVAAIDMGTNTFQMVVGQWQEGALDILYRKSVFVMIGRDGISNGTITDDACDRAVEALKVFRDIIDWYQIVHVEATATSAIRSARNGEALLQKIKEATGILPRAIKGDEEAEFIYYGVRSVANLTDEKVLILDIGGGSVEFIIADQKEIFWKQSIEIGAQRLYDLFHKFEPIGRESVIALENYLHDKLMMVANQVAQWQPEVLIGCAGTFDTVRDIHCYHTQQQDRMREALFHLTPNDYLVIHQQFLEKDREARLAIKGMLEKRVDMIVVASCIVAYMLKSFYFKEVQVCRASLKEGLLWKMLQQNGGAKR